MPRQNMAKNMVPGTSILGSWINSHRYNDTNAILNLSQPCNWSMAHRRVNSQLKTPLKSRVFAAFRGDGFDNAFDFQGMSSAYSPSKMAETDHVSVGTQCRNPASVKRTGATLAPTTLNSGLVANKNCFLHLSTYTRGEYSGDEVQQGGVVKRIRKEKASNALGQIAKVAFLLTCGTYDDVCIKIAKFRMETLWMHETSLLSRVSVFQSLKWHWHEQSLLVMQAPPFAQDQVDGSFQIANSPLTSMTYI